MAVTYGFYNAIKQSDGTYDRTYNSDQISDMFEGILTSGVYEGYEDAMIVKSTGMFTVGVGAGRAVMSDGKWVKNDSQLSITLQDPHMTLSRWSAIVIRENKTDRTISIVEKAGTPATNPVKPTMVVSQTMEEKCLAYIYVKNNALLISQADITDMRASELCGWVTGVVKQVDTAELFLQYQKAYEQNLNNMNLWMTTQKTLFENWYSSLTQQLQVNAYIQKFEKTTTLTQSDSIIELDMSGYTYESSDIIIANVDGISLVKGEDYSIIDTVTPAEIRMYTSLDSGSTINVLALKAVVGSN